MKQDTRAFVELFAKHFSNSSTVYEFGSILNDGDLEKRNIRPLFMEQKFIGCDTQHGPGVDRIENFSSISLLDESIDTLLCLGRLEKVFEIQQTIQEFMRVLAPSGIILLTMPLNHKIDSFPDDYWRMTPACMMRMLSPLDGRIIGSQGNENYPHTIYALAAKAPIPENFNSRCASLIADFQDWLMFSKKNRAFPQRVKNWCSWMLGNEVEAVTCSKYYDSRFVIDLPMEEFQNISKNSLPKMLASQSTGSRINLSE